MTVNTHKIVKILEVKELLETQTDDAHSLSVQEIMEALQTKGISSERKSIYAYVDQLEAYGLDIITTRDIANRYHVGNRTFQLAELKLLVDAVQFSKFITREKSQELMEKLKTLTSDHEAKLLYRDDLVSDRLKTKNNSIYLNVDAIHEAILKQVKLRFKYFDYDLNKEPKFRRNGDFYTMIPVFLCWDDEKYYCVMYHETHQSHVVFRVDKMREVSVLDIKHQHIRKAEDFELYSTKIFSMYGGENQEVTLQFDQSLINVVLDRFGLDTHINILDDQHFTITTELLVSPTFISWLFQFEDHVKILSPQNVVDQARSMLEKTLHQYR